MMKWIDIPPVWLTLALVLSWRVSLVDPLGFGGPWSDFVAGLLVGAGIILMLLAVVEMRKWRTTFVPHRDAAHLVTSGIFRRSRNPIYLGDLLVLAGAVFYWDTPLSLVLLPVFLWWIERHFVVPEENRLRRKFRIEFARYCDTTRRWL